MSLLNRLMGRGPQPADHTESAHDYPSGQAHVSQPRNESQFMQSGRTGYLGEEHMRTYELPAGIEQQGLAQTEGVNSPFDVQQHGVHSQHVGSKPVQVFDADETRGERIQEPLRERTTREEGLREGVTSHHNTGIGADNGAAIAMEQPRSPRSPRKEGMGTKMKKMFKPHKYEQEREERSSGEYVDAQDMGTSVARHPQTTDDTTAGRISSSMPAHSTSAGGLSPRGNWNPTEGFNFRKSSTPPHVSGRREEKAAIAVAKHDGGHGTTRSNTPLETSGYEGGDYDNYGDNSPVMHDVPHSRPGRYASGEQGGAWGDHRASEVGSFRGSGMHSPSKERPPRDSQRPTWVAPGAEHDPAVAAAAAAGGAAAAKAVTRNERGGHFSGNREGGVSVERASLQGRTGSLSSQERDNSRYGRSTSARETVTEQRTSQSRAPNRAMSGSGLTNRAEPTGDIRDYYQSPAVHVQPTERASEERKLEREPFGSGQDIGYDNEEEVGRDRDGLTRGHVNQRVEHMKLNDVEGRNDMPLGSATPGREFGRHTGEQEFDFNNQGLSNQGITNQGYGDPGYVNRSHDYDSTIAKSSSARGYDNQEVGAGYSNREFANQNSNNLSGKSVNSQSYGNQDVTDPQTGAQNFGVGGRLVAETPYQLGERISDRDSNVRGYERTGERSPAVEESFGVGGATTARTPYGLGEKISDKSWNEERAPGVHGENFAHSGYDNQKVIYPQTGAQNFVGEDRSEAETPYRAGKRSRNQNEESRILNTKQSGARSSAVEREQSFGEGGATTTLSPQMLGEKTPDMRWNEERSTGLNNGGGHHSRLEAGALGTGAIGAGSMAADHMPGRTSSEFQRSTVTGEPILDRESEIAMGQGRAAEAPPAAAAAATQHAATEQSDLDSSYVKESPETATGQSGMGSLRMNESASGLATQAEMGEPPMSPRSQQYLQHGEPVKSPSLLTSAKYAFGRAQNKLTNTHHHLTAGGGTISSVTGVAFGKLDVVAKRMLHGGEHLWREAFHPPPEEHLRKSFACLLSTESGAVAGVLYLSDHNLWFCSDRALQRAVKASEADVASPPSYEQYQYKVVLPLAEVAHIESRANGRSERDKSIKVEMTGSEQFWFFGFVTFEKALLNLQHAREVHGLRSASMKAGGA
ncbi:GRAM domain containing protein [Klebsormidium nitens]|uniref:GRAM domain containing protein n=1 Tax=Klebsormidium nitens TaxID=105231 RepID=A0A1Y1IBU1_KLENI|nr:GRAM domain containing protein [Klebsormidium nitens]|eukprot:GAQ87432.1 GRAM domain containing protein [Klebsormidium nitens]